MRCLTGVWILKQFSVTIFVTWQRPVWCIDREIPEKNFPNFFWHLRYSPINLHFATSYTLPLIFITLRISDVKKTIFKISLGLCQIAFDRDICNIETECPPLSQEKVMTWFKGQAADFYDSGIQKLVPRLNKYLDNAGDYVEK